MPNEAVRRPPRQAQYLYLVALVRACPAGARWRGHRPADHRATVETSVVG